MSRHHLRETLATLHPKYTAAEIRHEVADLWGDPEPAPTPSAPLEPDPPAPACLRCGWPMCEPPAEDGITLTARLAAAERAVNSLMAQLQQWQSGERIEQATPRQRGLAARRRQRRLL